MRYYQALGDPVWRTLALTSGRPARHWHASVMRSSAVGAARGLDARRGMHAKLTRLHAAGSPALAERAHSHRVRRAAGRPGSAAGRASGGSGARSAPGLDQFRFSGPGGHGGAARSAAAAGAGPVPALSAVQAAGSGPSTVPGQGQGLQGDGAGPGQPPPGGSHVGPVPAWPGAPALSAAGGAMQGFVTASSMRSSPHWGPHPPQAQPRGPGAWPAAGRGEAPGTCGAGARPAWQPAWPACPAGVIEGPAQLSEVFPGNASGSGGWRPSQR